MFSKGSDERPLHIVTPLLRSAALAKHLPMCKNVYLKMENCQISGSFKIRGFGLQCQKLKQEGCQRLVVASSGNTGLAVASASQMIGIPCTVFVPENSPLVSAERLQQNGAQVVVKGADFSAAAMFAQQEAKKPGASYVNPMDPRVWAGHSTVVDELVIQLSDKPSVIVAAVGDGGLLTGVLKGLERAGWQDVPVVAMETVGTHCFNLSVTAKKMIVLDKITSVATCLGNSAVNPHLLNILSQFNVISEVVTDAQAITSCIKFADDEYTIVEPGCGASLASVYCGVLTRLHAEGKLPHLESRPAVIIVCGGRSVSLHLLQDWAKQFNVPFPST